MASTSMTSIYLSCYRIYVIYIVDDLWHNKGTSKGQ